MEVLPYEYKALDYKVHDHPIRLLTILPGEYGSPISCELFHTHLVDDKPAPASALYRGGVLASEDDSEDNGSGGTTRERNPEYTALSYVWGDHTDRASIRLDDKLLSVTINLFRFLDCHRDNFLTNKSTCRLFWIDAICIDQSNIDERSTQVQFMAEIYKTAKNVLVWLGEETESTALAFETLRRSVNRSRLSLLEAAACSKLFKGGWFDRLWVVQEALLARSKILRCGKFELGWESLKAENVPVAALVKFNGLRHHEEMRGTGVSAVWMLQEFGCRKCFDPKDVIFALRSIAPGLMCVIPNYCLYTAEVFTAAARAITSGAESLRMLEYTNRNGKSQWSLSEGKPLPTWAPDWSMPSYGFLPYRSHAKFRQGDSIHNVLGHDDPDVLCLNGAAVDRILNITAILPDYMSLVRSESEPLKTWFPECDEEFLRINTQPELKLNNIIKNWLQQQGKPQKAFRTTETYVKEFFNNLRDVPGFMFITTESGRYGFVLGEARKGDMVFVAYGSCYPFVLRQDDTHENSFTLVGCAIVDELMDGEAFEMMEAGTLKEQVILLR